MANSEIADLLAELRVLGADHATCEVKKAKGGMPASIWESISALANAEGGHLLLGIDEKTDFTVTGVDDPAAMEAGLGAICAEMEPPVRAEIRTVRIEGKSVVMCVVPPVQRDQRPCHKRSLGPRAGSRIRVADGDRRMTDYEVSLLMANRSEPRYDAAPVISASVADLDPELLAGFLRRVRETRPRFAGYDDEHVLQLFNVLTEHEGRRVPTFAGLMVFGIYPQSFEPQLNLTVVVYPTSTLGALGRSGERFIDNRSLDGPIPVIISDSIQVLKRNMKRRSIISGTFRTDEWEYPEEVLREVIVNALVHRDYSEFARGTQVQVELYPDRLTVRNPGGLFGLVEVASLGQESVTSSRNKVLLKLLEDTPLDDGHMVCENRGTGIARMLMTLTEAGMDAPRFVDRISTFQVEFPNHALLDQDAIDWLTSLGAGPLYRSQMMGLATMRRGASLSNRSYRALTGIQDSRVAARELKLLVDAGLVVQAGSGRLTSYSIAPALPAAAAAEVDVISAEELSDADRRLLDGLADAVMSRPEIEQATGLTRSQASGALRRLREAGLVRMIGVPRSRNVRWTARPERS